MTIDELKSLIEDAKKNTVIKRPYKPTSALCKLGFHDIKYWENAVAIDNCQCQRCGKHWIYNYTWSSWRETGRSLTLYR